MIVSSSSSINIRIGADAIATTGINVNVIAFTNKSTGITISISFGISLNRFLHRVRWSCPQNTLLVYCSTSSSSSYLFRHALRPVCVSEPAWVFGSTYVRSGRKIFGLETWGLQKIQRDTLATMVRIVFQKHDF